MFFKNDILSRLKKGETLEDIAEEFTDALNDANDEYKKQVEVEHIIKAAKQKEQLADAKKLLVEIDNYFCKYEDDWARIPEDEIDKTAKDFIGLFAENLN